MSKERGIRRAILLAHGTGENCFPFGGKGSSRPKYAFEVGCVPLVVRAARLLVGAGVERVTVVLGFQPESMRKALAADGLSDRVDLVVADPYDQGDSGPLWAGWAHASGEGPVAVMNADVLVYPSDVDSLFSQFAAGGPSLALVDELPQEEDVQSWVTVTLESTGRIAQIRDHQAEGSLRLSGLYVFTPEDAKRLSSGSGTAAGKRYLFQDLAQQIQSGLTLGGLKAGKRVVHVDRCFDYLEANQEICMDQVSRIREASGVYKYVAGEGDPDPEFIFPGIVLTPGSTLVFEEGSFIGPFDTLEGHRRGIREATHSVIPIRIRGDLYLGKGSRIGMNALIEGGLVVMEDSSVEDSVVEKGVLIGNRVKVRRHAMVRSLTVCGHGSRYEAAADFEGVGGNGTIYMHPGQCWIVTGERCDLGAGNFVGTWRFDSGRCTYLVGDRMVRPWCDRISNASYIGDDVRTGVGVCLAPGTRVGPNALVGPGIQGSGVMKADTAYLLKQKDIVSVRVGLVRPKKK